MGFAAPLPSHPRRARTRNTRRIPSAPSLSNLVANPSGDAPPHAIPTTETVSIINNTAAKPEKTVSVNAEARRLLDMEERVLSNSRAAATARQTPAQIVAVPTETSPSPAALSPSGSQPPHADHPKGERESRGAVQEEGAREGEEGEPGGYLVVSRWGTVRHQLGCVCRPCKSRRRCQEKGGKAPKSELKPSLSLPPFRASDATTTTSEAKPPRPQLSGKKVTKANHLEAAAAWEKQEHAATSSGAGSLESELGGAENPVR
eukprot:1186929-Prorocentrum_minimum.AAC.6